MKLKVGISNRHIHLCKEDYEILFGNEPLEIVRSLTQPEEYASNQFVILQTPKNKIEKVRVLGPLRNYTQVEISKTDAYTLGLNPPVRDSGQLEGSETVTIIGTSGKITKENCCIIATRHLHINEKEQELFDQTKKYCAKIESEKGGILSAIHTKVGNYMTELHLDTDDANAFLLHNGDEVEIFYE